MLFLYFAILRDNKLGNVIYVREMYRIQWYSPSSVNEKCTIIFSYEFLLKVSATSIQQGKQDDDTFAEISVLAAT